MVAISAANARPPRPAASAPAPDAARKRLRLILSSRTIMIFLLLLLCASPSSSVFPRLLAQMPQKQLLMFQELDAQRVAGARQPDRNDRLDATRVRRHDHDPVGEVDGLGYVVRDIDDRLAGLAPDFREQPLHLLAGHGV